MSFRISTAGIHAAAIAQMLTRQTELSKTQGQISSGKRVQTPADDPVAATQILDLQQVQAQLAQYGKNSDAATGRLETYDQAFSDASNLLQRVRELAIQANSAALDSQARSSLNSEIKARLQELQDIGNRQDASGDFLFSGLSTQTVPFSRGPGGVVYAGDAGVRAVQVSSNQRVVDGFSGQQAFIDIPAGNGTFTVAQGVHVGPSSIDSGQITNAQAWVSGTYTLQFTSPTAWQVTDALSNVVASGAYTSGSAIAFNGAQVTVTGSPATGDSYTIAPSGKQSMFAMLDALVAAVGSVADDPVSRASISTVVGNSLTQIDQSLSRIGNLRSEVGARLGILDTAKSAREQLDVGLTESVSKLQDLDYASAISLMNQQMTGLQAAQQAYSKISQLSLFNYL